MVDNKARAAMTKDEKRKLLWGGKKKTAEKTAAAWASSSALSGDRKARFLSLLGAGKSAAQAKADKAAQRKAAGKVLNSGEQDRLFNNLQSTFEDGLNRRLNPKLRGKGLGHRG